MYLFQMTRHDFFELYTVVLGQLAHNAISYNTLTNLVVITVFFLLRVHWAIPENIHTIPRTALRISEGEGGFTITEF